jgi:hypothetical protein
MSHHDHKLPSMRIGRASEMLPGDMLQGVLPIDMEALERIVAIRHDQIEKHGHTPESDAALPVDHIPEAVKRYAHRAWNRLHNNGSRQLAIGELERCAALCLAAIARLKQEDRG